VLNLLPVRISLKTHQGQERKETRGKVAVEVIDEGDQYLLHFFERKPKKQVI